MVDPVRVLDFRGTYKGGGGPDKTILNSAVRHDPSRVYVQVAYLRDPADLEYSIDTWAASLGVNYVDFPDRKLIDRQCVADICNLIRAQKLQVVHAHDEKTLLYGWMIRRAIPDIRLLYTCHLHSPYVRQDFDSLKGYLDFRLRRRIAIALMRRFDKPLLAVSRHTKMSMVADGLQETDIEVLHNGIDTDTWYPEAGKPVLRNELGLQPGEYLVGTVARIAQQHKDLPTFYKVAATVARQMPNVKFVIVGDGHGDELIKARDRVAALGLQDRFFFTGHRIDLFDVYTSFDVFLMTSLTEGLPNTVLEAMAMEIPVVSTAVAGVPELVEHGKTGYLTPLRDVDGLANSVLQLLRDPARCREFGLQARERILKDFSFINRVKQMEDYYISFAEKALRDDFRN